MISKSVALGLLAAAASPPRPAAPTSRSGRIDVEPDARNGATVSRRRPGSS